MEDAVTGFARYAKIASQPRTDPGSLPPTLVSRGRGIHCPTKKNNGTSRVTKFPQTPVILKWQCPLVAVVIMSGSAMFVSFNQDQTVAQSQPIAFIVTMTTKVVKP